VHTCSHEIPSQQAHSDYPRGRLAVGPNSLEDSVPGVAPSPVKPLRIALLGYRSQPYGGGQGVYLKYLSKALVEAGHHVDVISGPPYPHLDSRVRLIELPSLDLFENGLVSLRPRHLSSLTNIIEWTSKLTGGFAEPYTFGRRAVKYLKQHGHNYDLIHDNQSLSRNA
jgi:glycosyltransferase involved in cell wall biosynthesis